MAIDFRDVRQTEAAECGLVCLSIASGLLGAELDLATLRRTFPVSTRGLTLKEISDLAANLNMSGRAVRCELEDLRKLSCPAILHWGLNHFVVLERATRRNLYIIDPARGSRTVSIEETSKSFTGVALEIIATPDFKKKREKSSLSILSLFRWTPNIVSGLAQAFLISLLLQAYVVATPFYMQLAIDEGVLKGDTDLVLALAIGFGLFALFNAGAEALRGVALQKVSALLAWDMTQRLFHHMLRLPLPWFQRRRLADALTRFDSLTPVKNLVANGLVAVVLDGLLSIVTVVMMVLFAPMLAAVAVFGLLLHILVRVTTIPLTMKLGMAALTASIAEQGKRIETLRAIQTIKVMAAEPEREGDWANRFADTVRANQSNALTQVGISTTQRLIDALALVLTTYLGVKAVVAQDMTVGVLYAFLSYRTQFLSRAQSLVEQMVNWRLLEIHTHRLADIALHPPEPGLDRSQGGLPPIRGKIELKNVAFSYSPHEPLVFKGIDIVIEPGEFVAIVGPSGSGKSTLLKVLCGLYPASYGEVLLDDLPLAAWGTRTARRALGVVMQDDELLSGSIAENVSFFDDAIDIDHFWTCLEAASVADDIRAMPMRADTLVGEMGSSLSGGQKQRLLLARALYRRPQILLLDEATSHLDIQKERSINEALRRLAATRIIVAHRPDTIAAADRVILLDGGTVAFDQRRPRIEPSEAPSLVS